MNAQDIIKSMLAVIDGVAQPQQEPEVVQVVVEPNTGEESPLTNTPGDDVNRFKQIVDLLDKPQEQGSFDNEPNPSYADIDSVTVDAGGGMNGPKHPHDIRLKDPSAYPHEQDDNCEQKPERSPLHAALLNAMRGM